MKNVLIFLAMLPLVWGCGKQFNVSLPSNDAERLSVLARLRDSMSVTDYRDLDTTVAYVGVHTGDLAYWRIPFRGKPVTTDFVLVRTDGNGGFLGRIVHLERTDPAGSWSFNGSITVSSLSRELVMASGITKGFIDARHGGRVSGVETLDVKQTDSFPDDELPECVVIGYVNNQQSMPIGYIELEGAMGGTGGGGSGSGGAGASGPTGGSGTGTGGGSGPAPQTGMYDPVDPTGGSQTGTVLSTAIRLEPDYSDNIPTVNLTQMFNCFSQVPDAGATYTVQLCSDVPVNNIPGAAVNIVGFSAGHTFLVATKSNAGVSVTQAFGFYPAEAPPLTAPFTAVPAVIKDNGNQEVNASLSVSVSAAQFAAFKASALQRATLPYALASNNCSDYAVNVFNAAMTTPIVLQPYEIEVPVVNGNPATGGVTTVTVPVTNSPQMLFYKLSAMKQAGTAGIVIDQTSSTHSPASHGECN